MLGLVSIGATLPVPPRYVKGPIGAGDVAIGIVLGSFAITGLACRPLARPLADPRGRRRAARQKSVAWRTGGSAEPVSRCVPRSTVNRRGLRLPRARAASRSRSSPGM
jgi:hypothetical protein